MTVFLIHYCDEETGASRVSSAIFDNREAAEEWASTLLEAVVIEYDVHSSVEDYIKYGVSEATFSYKKWYKKKMSKFNSLEKESMERSQAVSLSEDVLRIKELEEKFKELEEENKNLRDMIIEMHLEYRREVKKLKLDMMK